MDAYWFDLGNVLVSFSHRIFCRRLAEECRPWHEDDILRIVFGSDLNERFETGRIEGEEFYSQVRRLLGFSVSLDRFRELWCDIFWENPGMAAMLKSLRAQARLLLVSNTNPWHIEFSKRKFSVLACFDRLVLSYEVGAVKPATRFFEAALEAAGTRPERCLYFDDLEENVRAAARLGIPSAQLRFFPA